MCKVYKTSIRRIGISTQPRCSSPVYILLISFYSDIKGANILTTKESVVKLADFGVAVALNESQEATVVGTPYWMAPEVIQMAGPTSACDIWSVGCTIIELLTGSPPYYDLQPMAALYRIVQDDHPPIPDIVSSQCKEFLLECFKKEPTFRLSAGELLKHQWMNPQKEIKQQQESISHPTLRKPKVRQTPTIESNTLRFNKGDLTMYREDDNDDDDMTFDDLIPDSENGDDSNIPSAIRLSLKEVDTRSLDEDFANLDFSDSDEDDILGIDKLERHRLENELQTQINHLNVSDSSNTKNIIIQSCIQIMELFNQEPDLKASFLTIHVISSLFPLLEYNDNDVKLYTLKLLYSAIESEPKSMETILLVGIFPLIIQFCDYTNTIEIRNIAALFIKEIFSQKYDDDLDMDLTTNESLVRSLIACGGIPALVKLLKSDYTFGKYVYL